MQVKNLRLSVCTALHFGFTDECLILTNEIQPSSTAVVLLHGFNQFGGWGMIYTAQRLIKLGYTVVLPSQRGFNGSGGIRDYCGPDTVSAIEQILSEFLEHFSNINRTNLAIWGISRGASVAALLLEQNPSLFRCGVLQAGIYDFVNDMQWKKHNQKDIYENIMTESGGSLDALRARSAMFAVERLQTPVLVIHGENDLTTPASQAIEFTSALLRANKTVELKIVPGMGHKVTGHRNIEEDVFSFLRKHLAPLDEGALS